MFRSAAVHFRERVIGVILSGPLDDGVAGMTAIKRCGGVCIVQDPTDAEYADLPVAFINAVVPDHTFPVDHMAETIVSISSARRKRVMKIPAELTEESKIA